MAQLNIEDSTDEALKEIASILEGRASLRIGDVVKVSKNVCRRFGLKALPGNSLLLSRLEGARREELRELLKVKPVRTSSGIAVVAAMTSPQPCPHGSCIYCPGGVKFGTPQSYLGGESAAMRAAEHNFDPYRQVQSRLKQLYDSGHNVGKAELIVLGGTFLSFPLDYQRSFIKGLYDGLNSFKASSLKEAQAAAEKAQIRNVGLTIETRPDVCKREHVDLMLSYGCTRVEIGVQALNDEVYRIAGREHTLSNVIEAFRIAKDAGYKIGAHMMPGLPSSSPKKDLEAFQRLFTDPEFKPDMLKIYPTLVVPGTVLYEWWREGRYTPYDLDTVVDLLADVKRIIPRWVRIMRISREIPAHEIAAGVKHGNLRELVLREVERRGYRCSCIRCREVGLRKGVQVDPEELGLLEECYEASGGVEVFISFEDLVNNVLIGFVRIRSPSSWAHRREVASSSCCIVRELHVYGRLVPVGSRDGYGWQHRGYGAALMTEAERVARERFDADRLLVLSAVGTREYYLRLGYRREGPYMVKRLSS